MMRRLTLLVGLASLLAGCANDGRGGPLGLVFLDPNQHVSSAEPLFFKKEDQCISNPVFMMKATDGSSEIEFGADKKSGPPCEQLSRNLHKSAPPVVDLKLPTGNTASDRAALALDNQRAIDKRNAMMDAMIASSNEKCGRYISFIKAYDGNINNIYGIASLVTAGASPLVAGEATAKILAGVSAMLNGSRETINQTMFANQTIQVLASAIEKLRKEERREIRDYQQCPLHLYSTASGFADVLNYHHSCSVVYGLAETARDVERASQPDIATMKQMMAQLVELRAQAAAFGASTSGTDNQGAAPPAGTQSQGDVPGAKAQTAAGEAPIDGAAPPRVASDDGASETPDAGGSPPKVPLQMAASDLVPMCPLLPKPSSGVTPPTAPAASAKKPASTATRKPTGQ